MIKLNSAGRSAIYYASPYFSKINLTGAYVKSVKWDGDEGVMIADKNHCYYRIGLFPKLYRGKGDLKKKTQHHLHTTVRHITADLDRVGNQDFKLGYIYNLRQFNN